MADMARTCSKCAGELEEGYVLDQGYAPRKLVSSWVRGAPRLGFLGLGLAVEASKRIVAWRCTRCGLLEMYAR